MTTILPEKIKKGATIGFLAVSGDIKDYVKLEQAKFEFEKRGFRNTNLHDTIYVVTPEYNANNQLIFRDNTIPAIKGKNVILLLATTTTGLTVRRSLECVQYYGGTVHGISSIFSTVKKVGGMEVHSVFNADDVPGYQAFGRDECPYCKKGFAIEAMVNGFGYSQL